MLQREPSRRPNINEVLKRPVMQRRIRQFLSESIEKSEFSHTVLHGQHPMRSVGPNAPRPGAAQPAPSRPPKSTAPGRADHARRHDRRQPPTQQQPGGGRRTPGHQQQRGRTPGSAEKPGRRPGGGGGESFLRVHWVAVPKALRARRVNRRWRRRRWLAGGAAPQGEGGGRGVLLLLLLLLLRAGPPRV
jgi:hypothetical protein